jgi:hypothetical protein
MDPERVRQLVEFCLACAGREDDPRERQLGPIHVLKYVYLADVAYAERNGGVTFTRAAWKFYHFGPWSAEVHNLLEPTARAAGAEVAVMSSRYDKDTVRWALHDDDLYDKLVERLPSEVTNVIREAVHRFGSGTGDLLNYVYLTRPMLKAAPGEVLDFTPPEAPAPSQHPSPTTTAGKPSRTDQQPSASVFAMWPFRRRSPERAGRSWMVPLRSVVT